MLNDYCYIWTHLQGAGPIGPCSSHSWPSYKGAPHKRSKYRQVRQGCSKSEWRPATIKGDFFLLLFLFFFGEMIKPRGGDQTSCKKPHPEQALPRLTVNKYSPCSTSVNCQGPGSNSLSSPNRKGEKKRVRWQIGGLICFLLKFSLVGRFQSRTAASCLGLVRDPTFPVNLHNCIPGGLTQGWVRQAKSSSSLDQISHQVKRADWRQRHLG